MSQDKPEKDLDFNKGWNPQQHTVVNNDVKLRACRTCGLPGTRDNKNLASNHSQEEHSQYRSTRTFTISGDNEEIPGLPKFRGRKNRNPKTPQEFTDMAEKLKNIVEDSEAFNKLALWKQWFWYCLPLLDENFCGLITKMKDEKHKILRDDNARAQRNGIGVGPRTIQRYLDMEVIIGEDGTSRAPAAIAYEFRGMKDFEILRPVPRHIIRHYEDMPCVHTNIRVIQVDHKFDYWPELYDDNEFKNNKDNYQPLKIFINGKKRQCKKHREETGYKFDNRNFGLIFSTTKDKLKFDITELSVKDPYDGEYLTDVVRAKREDINLTINYLDLFRAAIPGLSKEVFFSIIVPKINAHIQDDDKIQNYDAVLKFVLAQLGAL